MAYIGKPEKLVNVPEPVKAPSWVPQSVPERLPELVPVGPKRASDA